MYEKGITVLATVLALSAPAFAATVKTVNATASVTAVLDLTMTVFKLDAAGVPTGSALTTMPFGTLADGGFGTMTAGANVYAVYLGANSSSRLYNIKATMPAMTSGTATLPSAMGMTVVSAKSGSGVGVDIVGDIVPVGTQNAIMTNQTIYNSNAGGTGANVQLVYGISGGTLTGTPFTGWQPILLDQAAGAYAATATYTIALG